MGKHGYGNRGYRDSHGRRDGRDPRMTDRPVHDEAPRRLPRKLPMAAVLVGLVLWSLLAWAGYALVDPVLGWVAASAGFLLDSGKDIATATGAGKEVGVVVDGLNASGLLGQVVALLRGILKPTIVVVWVIGALVLIAAPAILPRIGRLLAAFRH